MKEQLGYILFSFIIVDDTCELVTRCDVYASWFVTEERSPVFVSNLFAFCGLVACIAEPERSGGGTQDMQGMHRSHFKDDYFTGFGAVRNLVVCSLGADDPSSRSAPISNSNSTFS